MPGIYRICSLVSVGVGMLEGRQLSARVGPIGCRTLFAWPCHNHYSPFFTEKLYFGLLQEHGRVKAL